MLEKVIRGIKRRLKDHSVFVQIFFKIGLQLEWRVRLNSDPFCIGWPEIKLGKTVIFLQESFSVLDRGNCTLGGHSLIIIAGLI